MRTVKKTIFNTPKDVEKILKNEKNKGGCMTTFIVDAIRAYAKEKLNSL